MVRRIEVTDPSGLVAEWHAGETKLALGYQSGNDHYDVYYLTSGEVERLFNLLGNRLYQAGNWSVVRRDDIEDDTPWL